MVPQRPAAIGGPDGPADRPCPAVLLRGKRGNQPSGTDFRAFPGETGKDAGVPARRDG